MPLDQRMRIQLVAREQAERVEGVGIPPLGELLQKLVDHSVPVYV